MAGSVLQIVDTTLRDGEQAAGIVFSKEEKIRIARFLDKIGIAVIEAGIPAMGPCEQEVIEILLSMGLKAKIMTWNRALLSDVKASVACGVEYVHISVPVSDIHIKYKLGKSRQWVIDSMVRAVTFAREKGCTVSVGAEDASRADQEFVVKLATKAEEAGAVRFRYADTVGVLDPFQTYENIKRLKNFTGLAIEFHAHNDFGLAVANALSAYRAGATWIDTTVNGIGERAGNTCLEDFLKAFHLLHRCPWQFDKRYLSLLANYVRRAVGRCFVGRGMGEGSCNGGLSAGT